MSFERDKSILGRLTKAAAVHGLKIPDEVLLSSGEDFLFFDIGNDKVGLIVSTTQIDMTHFRSDLTKPDNIGYKAMGRTISAMIVTGGRPKYCFISLNVPPHIKEEYLHELYKGILLASKEAEMTLIGGEISKSDKITLILSIYGETKKEIFSEKKGPAAGEKIFVTGFIGASLAGQCVLLKEKKELEIYENYLVNQYQRPKIRYDIQKDILTLFNPSSMIDINKGLFIDLRKMTERSNKGFLVDLEKIPIPSELRMYCKKKGFDPINMAVRSGMELEMLFTSSKSIQHLEEPYINGVKLTEIGEVTDEGFKYTYNGKIENVVFESFFINPGDL